MVENKRDIKTTVSRAAPMDGDRVTLEGNTEVESAISGLAAGSSGQLRCGPIGAVKG